MFTTGEKVIIKIDLEGNPTLNIKTLSDYSNSTLSTIAMVYQHNDYSFHVRFPGTNGNRKWEYLQPETYSITKEHIIHVRPPVKGRFDQLDD
jgi:hypothetical protein